MTQLTNASFAVSVQVDTQLPNCNAIVCRCSVCARERYRISPPRFLAECRKIRLNQASFVLLCFALFTFCGLSLVFVSSVFNLSSVLYFPASTDVNGTL